MDDKDMEQKINRLAVAEFREFCKNNDLCFFFPDQHSNEQADPAFINQQFPLINEAVNLFHRTNPRIYGDDSVIEFNFASWMPGDIDYNINTAASLISERDSMAGDLEKLKKVHRFFVVFGSFSLLVLSAWLINKLAFYFDPIDEYHILSALFLIPMLGALFLESAIKKVVERFDNLKKETERDKFERALMEIRIKLGFIAIEGQKKSGLSQVENPH